VATPLAVTVAELLQNAVEHGFDPELAHDDDGVGTEDRDAEGTAPMGHVEVVMVNSGTELTVTVQDDGVGLPEGFDIEQTNSLGLSIVRDLVISQLEGQIAMEAVPEGEGRGTRVVISVPVRAPH